jgi:hypothetical protein
VSVDVEHDMTVKTALVDTALASPAFAIAPCTVTVYTPATVGAAHATVLVAESKVINDVLWPESAVIVALYTMSDC